MAPTASRDLTEQVDAFGSVCTDTRGLYSREVQQRQLLAAPRPDISMPVDVARCLTVPPRAEFGAKRSQDLRLVTPPNAPPDPPFAPSTAYGRGRG